MPIQSLTQGSSETGLSCLVLGCVTWMWLIPELNHQLLLQNQLYPEGVAGPAGGAGSVSTWAPSARGSRSLETAVFRGCTFGTGKDL